MSLFPSFQVNKSLKDLSTFKIGGVARFFIEVFTVDEMKEVFSYCQVKQLPFFLLGKGSNCLFDDRGFDGLVIHNKISFLNIDRSEVEVGAGYSFSLLGVKTAKLGLSGLEFASGIPATVGGAIFMNAGANGKETADSLSSVSFLDVEGVLHHWSKKDLQFAYRFSSFQEKKGAIISAKFMLIPCEEARSKQLSIIEYRMKTQPYDDASIGCVFKNPEGTSAGALIEQSGLKGLSLGGAAVSLKHANFIVNKREARAADVLTLARLVQERVKETTGIELEMEVRCIPYQL